MNGPDNVPPSASPDSDEPSEGKPYYILRRGEILGPFHRSSLESLIKEGRIDYDDFAQEVGDSDWSPLRWVLIPSSAEDLEGALAPTWGTLIKWAWLRLRYNLDEKSLTAGWVCLGLALAGLFLSRWPVLLWAPWAVFAFFGGIALYRRERTAAGISLMLAAALVPGALWAYFWTDSISAARLKPAPAGEIAQSTPTPAVPATPDTVAAIPALAVAPAAPASATPSVTTPTTPPPLPPVEKPAEIPPNSAAIVPVQPIPQSQPEPATQAPPSPVPLQPQSSPRQPLQAPSPEATPANPIPLPNVSAQENRAISRPHRVEEVIYVVNTDAGDGSAFAVKLDNRSYIVTNFHVLSGAKTASIKNAGLSMNLDPSSMIEVANDRDLVRIPVNLPVALTPRIDVPLNESVSVYGNPAGQGIVTAETGKLIGTGINEIEVTAGFISGNSGGPITDSGGELIAVATYAVLHSNVDEWLTRNTRFANPRRFGVRLTDEVRWTAIRWDKFSEQTAMLRSIESYREEARKLAFELFRNPYSANFNQKLQSHRTIERTTFHQSFLGEIAGYNGVRIALQKKDGAMFTNDGLRRANQSFRSKVRGQMGSLGTCLKHGAEELDRLTIATPLTAPFIRESYNKAVKELKALGTELLDSKNQSNAGSLLTF